MRRSGRTLRSRPSLHPVAEIPSPYPAARACVQQRRKYREKRYRGRERGGVGLGQGGPNPSLLLPRALPGPCAAGPGRKRLRRSRTANGPQGSSLVRSLNTSLLLPTPGGSHGLCLPGSGEGGSPLHYIINTFSDLYACPAALHTSRLPHGGEGSSTPPMLVPVVPSSQTPLVRVGAGASRMGSGSPLPSSHLMNTMGSAGAPLLLLLHCLTPHIPLSPGIQRGDVPLSHLSSEAKDPASDQGLPPQLQADTPILETRAPVPDHTLLETTRLLTFSPRRRGFCTWKNKCYFRLSETGVVPFG